MNDNGQHPGGFVDPPPGREDDLIRFRSPLGLDATVRSTPTDDAVRMVMDATDVDYETARRALTEGRATVRVEGCSDRLNLDGTVHTSNLPGPTGFAWFWGDAQLDAPSEGSP